LAQVSLQGSDNDVSILDERSVAMARSQPLGVRLLRARAGRSRNTDPLVVGIVGWRSRANEECSIARRKERSPIMLPIPGTSSIEHLEDNVAGASLRLTDGILRKAFGRPRSGGIARLSPDTIGHQSTKGLTRRFLRFSSASFLRRLETWNFAVRSLMFNWTAISLFVRCLKRSWST
jgi:hypothetical protein